MMKANRLVVLLLTVIVALSLTAGCGGNTPAPPADGDTPPGDQPNDDPIDNPIEDPQDITGKERLVPADYATIQAAIDAASDGDTVIVSPGTYVENINYQGKNITVRSTDPANTSVVESTIIDGNGQGSVVVFERGETREAVLAGFTITNGSNQEGGGILIASMLYFTSATIQNNIIVDNNATYGGGLFVQSSRALIIDNVLKANTASMNGGALLVGQDTELEIRGNTYEGNRADLFGGAIAVQTAAEIVDNNFINNSAGMGGGAISIHAGHPDIRDNNFSGNDPDDIN